MKTEMVPITINLLDKEYRIACPEEERDALLQSARYLNDKMREVRDSGKVVGMDRISVMAGLNIAHELLQHQDRIQGFEIAAAPRLLALQDKINQILDRSRQLEL